MEIVVKITADDRALEFSRNLGKLLEKVVSNEVVKTEVEKVVVNEVTETPAEKPKITLEEVRKKASEYLEKDPKKLARTIQSFGCGRIPDLNPDQYEAFLEALDA